MVRAEEFFTENQRLFTDVETEPEKYNLYGGLATLARDVAQLQNRVEVLIGEVDNLRRGV